MNGRVPMILQNSLPARKPLDHWFAYCGRKSPWARLNLCAESTFLASTVWAKRVAQPLGVANRAGDPQGHDRAKMVLGPFAETKGPWPPGQYPANKKATTEGD